MTKLPVFYLSHGSPESGFVENETSRFWNRLGNSISCLPDVKCILSISAHWEERPVKVNSTIFPETIYDFYGFPSHYYEYNYPGKGAPDIAHRISQLLAKKKISSAEDAVHGLDHGTWVPLKWMLPAGNIPVVQLSLLQGGSMHEHVAIGQALHPLREEGVVIVASGTAVHNMIDWRRGRHLNDWVADYVELFDKHLEEIVTKFSGSERNTKLVGLEHHMLLRKAHPSLEHLLPLHVAGGAAGSDVGRKLYSHREMSFSSASYVFGEGVILH